VPGRCGDFPGALTPHKKNWGLIMSKLIAQVTAISLLCAGSAVAADMRMPVKAPPPAAPVAVYSWSGCYVGAGGGYGMYNQESQFVDGVVGPFGLSNDNGGRGWFGTVQVGCDLQIGSSWVIGAFADYDFSGIKGDMAVPLLGWVGQDEKLKNSWAAGGRIGWLPFQQQLLLVYVSGGYTQARFNGVDFASVFDGSPTGFSIDKHRYSGWFIGTGYEYGIGWIGIPGLFWKTEYRFADYGSDTVPIVFSATGIATGDSLDLNKRVHTVRSELVWRFNWGGGRGVLGLY
jgi:outer membrane immunogenic protein